MSDFLQIAATFYAQFPTPIVRDDQGVFLEKELREILASSPFLSDTERENMPKILPFLGTKSLLALRDSLVRKNLRLLLNKIQ